MNILYSSASNVTTARHIWPSRMNVGFDIRDDHSLTAKHGDSRSESDRNWSDLRQDRHV